MSTKIEWADKTWNPVTGCTPVSPGCANCYAKRMATRLAGRCGYPAENPFAVTLHPDRLEQPLSWRKPQRIFVCSMSDLFHEEVADGYRVKVFKVMRRCMLSDDVERNHKFLLLTKRPQNMRDFVLTLRLSPAGLLEWEGEGACLPHVTTSIWLGVTVESQLQTWRLDHLVNTPAICRFVSVEPMLSPVDLTPWLPSLDWVICGGETGPGHRPMSGLWAMDLLAQCRAYRVPFFFKKMAGGVTPIPQSLQVHEFPEWMEV